MPLLERGKQFAVTLRGAWSLDPACIRGWGYPIMCGWGW
jgi:hypothetical protein